LRTFNPEVKWIGLIPGLMIAAISCTAAYLILTRVGVGRLPGEKFTLYALADQARGVVRGTDVWLAGKRVGGITGLEFLPPVPGSTERVLLQLEVLVEHRDLLRRDTRAQAGPGSKLIGNPVIHLTLGSLNQIPLADGDTIAMLPQFDADIALIRAEQAMSVYPSILEDVRAIMSSAEAVDTVIRTILAGGPPQAGGSQIGELLASVQLLRERFATGSAGGLISDSLLPLRLQDAEATVDGLLRHYDIPNTPGGRMLLSGELFTLLQEVAVEYAAVTALLEARIADVTTGAYRTEMTAELGRLSAALAAMRADIRRNPFRYIVF
jgi:acetolactate synthase small subunit